MATTFNLNGEAVSSDAPEDAMLLWVLRERLEMTGTRFGCGRGACGACTVHVDGRAMRSCRLQLSRVAGRDVTTIEGLSPDRSHALQQAWVEEQVPQCGYCQSGQLMQAATLLAENPSPTPRGDREPHGRHPLSLRYLWADHPRHPARCG